MEAYQQRVVDEKTALDEKIAGLWAFIRSDAFKKLVDEEKMSLREQHDYMCQYSDVLEERIARFG